MPTEFNSGKRPANNHRLLIGFLVVVLGLYVAWKSSQQPAAKPEPVAIPQVKDSVPEATPATEEVAPQAAEGAVAPLVAKKVQTKISSVTIRDQDGKVIFKGNIDVGPTLQRIERGEKLHFSHDGIVFENREQRLPKKTAGYYREYVHPTAGQDGPGPQRIIKGKGTEIYYTHDHYRTFQRLDQP